MRIAERTKDCRSRRSSVVEGTAAWLQRCAGRGVVWRRSPKQFPGSRICTSQHIGQRSKDFRDRTSHGPKGDARRFSDTEESSGNLRLPQRTGPRAHFNFAACHHFALGGAWCRRTGRGAAKLSFPSPGPTRDDRLKRSAAPGAGEALIARSLITRLRSCEASQLFTKKLLDQY